MAKLAWDTTGNKLYETGVQKGVLYPYNTSTNAYDSAVAWDGLISVSENPSGADENKLYADDTKYLSLYSNEDFGCTIEAYMYPEEFAKLDGTEELGDGVLVGQQTRGMFGLSYRTTVGNDTEGEKYGYKLHLIYGCKAKPSSRQYQTTNESPSAITFSWEVSSTPIRLDSLVENKELKPTATIVIDSKKVNATVLAKIEKALYGTDADGDSAGTAAYLPTPAQIVAWINE